MKASQLISIYFIVDMVKKFNEVNRKSSEDDPTVWRSSDPRMVKMRDQASQTSGNKFKAYGKLLLTPTAGLLKRVNYHFDKVELHSFHYAQFQRKNSDSRIVKKTDMRRL